MDIRTESAGKAELVNWLCQWAESSPAMERWIVDLLTIVVEEIRRTLAFVDRGVNQVTPMTLQHLEVELAGAFCDLGRRFVSFAIHRLEERSSMPKTLCYDGVWYRRDDSKGAGSNRRGLVACLFGVFELRRAMYRPLEAIGESSIAPLEINLGLGKHGVTPALGDRIGWLSAACTQNETLDSLRRDNGVTLSVQRLRDFQASLASSMSEHQITTQSQRLLELMRQADASSGKRLPVLGVGHDGVFGPFLEGKDKQMEAAMGTVTVYDRKGHRLGTVYLGQTPEAGQHRMAAQMTTLISTVLASWRGPMPRLAYITDAGFHPTDYYWNTLTEMIHPRTGKPLQWHWVLDYYHAANRIGTLAHAIFGCRSANAKKQAYAWSEKQRKILRDKPNGARRVLHSATALKAKHGLKGSHEDYDEAFNYLSNHLNQLNYVEYHHNHLPIGSGVTEAACKTVFAYRFKQSGMKWGVATAQSILDLRVLRLSGVWPEAYRHHLNANHRVELQTPTNSITPPFHQQKAA